MLSGVTSSSGSIALDDVLLVSFGGKEMRVEFCDDEVAAGRQPRVVPLGGTLSDLRILVDSSAIEIYVNGGSTVFSTRWFPTDETLFVRSDLVASSAAVFPMAGA